MTATRPLPTRAPLAALALALCCSAGATRAQAITVPAPPLVQTAEVPTDHSLVVGRVGLRYFGAESVTLTPATGTTPADTAGIPVIGVRYWLREKMALEGGAGLLFAVPKDTGDTVVGFRFHAGAPILLGAARHLGILLVPSADLQYQTVSKSVGFKVGADVAAELQFGFIGVPQLSIQAQIGFALTNMNGNYTSVGTTVGPGYAPWDIFGTAFSATWYFGG